MPNQIPEAAVEALLPYVEPDNFGEGTDRMRRDNAARALQAAYPHLRAAFLQEFREGLVEEFAAIDLHENFDGDLHPAPDWVRFSEVTAAVDSLSQPVEEEACKRCGDSGAITVSRFEARRKTRVDERCPDCQQEPDHA